MTEPEYHEHVAGDRHAHAYNGPHSHGGVSALSEPETAAGRALAYTQGHGKPDRCSVHGDIPRTMSIRTHLMTVDGLTEAEYQAHLERAIELDNMLDRKGESEFPWEAYERALDDVAALVAGLSGGWTSPSDQFGPKQYEWVYRDTVFAAIDSLREKPPK